jgi:hypothetical protein
MPTTKIVNVRTQHTTGAGTVLSHAPTAAIPGNYSLHDCASPDQVGAHNCIWPIGGASGTLVFNKGLVVHTKDATATGSVSVTTA